jgi:hypothetical protein
VHAGPVAFGAAKSGATADSHKVHIWYLAPHDNAAVPPHQREVSPYFLEPNAAGHSSYVIGHDSCSNEVRA